MLKGLIKRGLNQALKLTGYRPERLIRDVPLPAPSSYSGPSFPLVDQLFMAPPFTGWSSAFGGVTRPYGQHTWVYACVNAISQNVSGIPLVFYAGTPKKKRLIESHPLISVLDAPNPMMSGAQLIEASYIYLGITGEAIWILDRPNVTAAPKEIWCFHPSRFQHVPDKSSGLVKGWIYRRGATEIPLQPHEVLFFRYFNPDDDYRGLSPIQAARLGIDQDYYAAQYNANFFKNGAQLHAYLETEENLSQEEFDRILAQFNNRHQGTSKAHQIGLLEGGLKYKEASLSQKDMDFLEGRKYNREEVMAVYKVPKSELGLYEQINMATAQTMDKVFWTKTLIPKMVLFETVLKNQLCSKLAGQPIWGEFDRTVIDALKEDQQIQADTATKYFGMGVPFQVINEKFSLGFPRFEGDDVGYLPFNLQPAGTPAPSQEAATAEPTPVKALVYPATPQLPAPSKAAENRQRQYQQFLKLHAAMEAKALSKVKRYFYELRKEQLKLVGDLAGEGKAVHKDIIDDILFNQTEANKKLNSTLLNLYLNIGQAAGEDLYAGLSFDPANFVMADSPAIQVLQEKLLQKVKDINSLTRDKLRNTLAEGMSETETVSQLQDRIRDVFNSFEHPESGSMSRYLTIARTETGQAMGAARDAAMDQLKVEKIEWATAGDNNVRNSHAAQNGKVVARGTQFPNGCAYPSDPAGPAGEIINCRCVALPVLED